MHLIMTTGIFLCQTRGRRKFKFSFKMKSSIRDLRQIELAATHLCLCYLGNLCRCKSQSAAAAAAGGPESSADACFLQQQPQHRQGTRSNLRNPIHAVAGRDPPQPGHMRSPLQPLLFLWLINIHTVLAQFSAAASALSLLLLDVYPHLLSFSTISPPLPRLSL